MTTINYNGMELECIESGYWPNGVTLVGTDNGVHFSSIMPDAVCLQRVRAIDKNGGTSAHWKYWAILPPKPAARRLTNREVYALWRKGWDVLNQGDSVINPCYCVEDENNICDSAKKLRAPNTDEWLEPTTDLLEVAK